MAVKTLKSLVLRGVSVQRDGSAVGARLDFSYRTASQLPEIHVSMRHGGWPRNDAEPEERYGRMHNPPVDNTALRAGRSDSRAGVLTRRTPTPVVGGTPFTGSRVLGGTVPTAAMCAGHPSAWRVALVGKTPPASVPALAPGALAARLCPTARGQVRLSLQRVRPSWSKQAGRTPPASTKGRIS